MATTIEREKKTIGAMVRVFCRGRHGTTEGICPECRQLQGYAERRLDKCPYGEAKPACSSCPVHCYSPGMREGIRRVMRHSGPRMIFHHPYLLLRHWLDAKRNHRNGLKKLK